jgi:mannose/fructose/N-acetylgalactosamine-specific phosphotransferase system component IIC
MQAELLLILLVGGLAALDKTEAFQTTLSQPLMIGPVVGLLLGDLSAGLRIGILLQLAYLWVMPIGTAAFPDSSVGAVAGSCGYVMLGRLFPDRPGLVLLLIVPFFIPFGLLAGWSLIKQRRLNFWLLPRADLSAEAAKISRFRHLFLLGLCGSFMRGVAITALGILCIFVLLIPLAKLLDFVPEFYLEMVELPFWGLGIGTMLYLFGNKRNLPCCIFGMILGTLFLLA